VHWRVDRHLAGRRSFAGRTELTALDAEIQWLEGRASLWRRRELQSSGLFFEPASGTIAYRGAAVGLSRLEAALLRVLFEQAGRPCSAADLLRIAWNGDLRTEAQLRNYIVRLRAKLETLNVPASIVTLRGHGYCLTTYDSNGRA
jgi:two-component system, OmpR family, response regulator QseB